MVQGMGVGTSNSSSKIALAIVVIPILIGVWFALPWFLPMWRWQNVDTEKIAREHAAEGVTKAQLETPIEFLIWYNPRDKAKKDPSPYQIVSAKPEWKTMGEKFEDEHDLLVRATVISERDGEPISKMWVSVNADENFFKIKGWRFPPGSFGKPKGRPVIVYDGFSLEKADIGTGQTTRATVQGWETDNDWADRDDGFGK
jgi:hypothetical protein